MNVDRMESVAQMPCLAGKDHFEFQSVQMHPCHVQEGHPGLPPQGSSKTACDKHFY